MPVPVYQRTTIKTRFDQTVSGTIITADKNTLLNRAAMDVFSEIDIRTSKRKSALSPNLFEDIYQYTLPSDLKGNRIIDIMPQTDRGRFDNWRLTTAEEFDRLKQDQRVDTADEPFKVKRSNWIGENLAAISDYDIIRKLLISKPVDDDEIVISSMDSATNWVSLGDGTAITADSSNYVRESASLSFDIGADALTTAGMYNLNISSFDITKYLSEGSIFLWVYIVSTTNLTNFILRLGSDSSNYYQITITTTNEGTAFANGWNLLRFGMADKTTTGTPTATAIDYVSIYMTKTAAKVSENDYRFDHLVVKLGKHYDVIYYSKYPWQSSSGTYLENSTADTDYLNVDTEELNLVEIKYSELAERYLKNHQQAEFNRQLYEKRKQEYQLNYPSESMVLSNTYQTINLDNQ